MRSLPSRSASSRAPVASTASFGRPRARAKTLVEPPGTTARPGQALRVGAVVQQTVDDLVDRAVAAEGHDQVDVAALRGLPGQVPGVPAVLGGDDLQLQLAGERVDQDVTGAGTGGGCCRIDHEKCAHAQQRTYLRGTGPGRGRVRERRAEAGAPALPCWGEQSSRSSRPRAAGAATAPGRPARGRPADRRRRARRARGLALAALGVYMLVMGLDGRPGQPAAGGDGRGHLLALAVLPLLAARGLLAAAPLEPGPGADHPDHGAAGGLDAAQADGALIPAAIALAVVAVAVLVLLVNPTTTEALGIGAARTP